MLVCRVDGHCKFDNTCCIAELKIWLPEEILLMLLHPRWMRESARPADHTGVSLSQITLRNVSLSKSQRLSRCAAACLLSALRVDDERAVPLTHSFSCGKLVSGLHQRTEPLEQRRQASPAVADVRSRWHQVRFLTLGAEQHWC